MGVIRVVLGISWAICLAACGGCRHCPTSGGHSEGTGAVQVPMALCLCLSIATGSPGDTVGGFPCPAGTEALRVADAATLATVAALLKSPKSL